MRKFIGYNICGGQVTSLWEKYNWSESLANFGVLLLVSSVILVYVLANINLLLFDLM